MPEPSEYHVASFVAHTRPELSDQISNFICQHQGTEIHAVSEQGKIVFTVEATHQKDIANTVDQIRIHDELYSLSPIYHQFLNETEEDKVS